MNEVVSERRIIDLDEIRADGWFEQLASQAPNFAELCRILGDKVLAFSVIAGIRISAITLDPNSAAGTTIEFSIGENAIHPITLPLRDFRHRLAMTLVVADRHLEELSAEPSADEVQKFIGIRYVLLAALFELRLIELHVGGGEVPVVMVGSEDDQQAVPLGTFRDIIDDRVRAEVDRVNEGSPFAIDLSAIPKAVRASRDSDWDEVIELLGSWPGPLSLLLRTQEGQTLAADVRSTLAQALGLLGTAYARTDHHDWAEEVMRLGIQWGQESAVAGELFRRLGESQVDRGRHGQAIGLLKRALALGALQRDVLPLLSKCFFARQRYVAAAVCLDDAIAAGAFPTEELVDLDAKIKAMLGDRWDRFREIVPRSSGSEPTVRPPGK